MKIPHICLIDRFGGKWKKILWLTIYHLKLFSFTFSLLIWTIYFKMKTITFIIDFVAFHKLSGMKTKRNKTTKKICIRWNERIEIKILLDHFELKSVKLNSITESIPGTQCTIFYRNIFIVPSVNIGLESVRLICLCKFVGLPVCLCMLTHADSRHAITHDRNMFLVIKFLFHCLLLLFHIWSCRFSVFFFFFFFI